jgi:hypothetical protein
MNLIPNPPTQIPPSAIEDTYGPIRAVEIAAREREPVARFHRRQDDVASGAQARDNYRSTLLANESLPDVGFQRRSCVLGYGRPQIPSLGAAEAFSMANYGGEVRVQGADGSAASAGATRSSLIAPRSGLAGITAWDVGILRADDAERAERAVSAAPNRIFDTESAPVIMSAVPDPFVREARELKEIRAKQPPRPANRPASFTETAAGLNQARKHMATLVEVETIRSLVGP